LEAPPTKCLFVQLARSVIKTVSPAHISLAASETIGKKRAAAVRAECEPKAALNCSRRQKR
jgi:hypothetical protein